MTHIEVELILEREVTMTVKTTVELDLAAMKRWWQWQDGRENEPLPQDWPIAHDIEEYVQYCGDFSKVPLRSESGHDNLDKEISRILFEGEEGLYSREDVVGNPDDWLISAGWMPPTPDDDEEEEG